MKFRWLCLIALLLLPEISRAVDWVRPASTPTSQIWGVRGGLIWALPPGGIGDRGGPRVLIRVGYPILTNGAYDLVNFIAVEPIVRGQKGFSELEDSKLDDKQGKWFWAIDETNITSLKETTSPRPSRSGRRRIVSNELG